MTEDRTVYFTDEQVAQIAADLRLDGHEGVRRFIEDLGLCLRPAHEFRGKLWGRAKERLAQEIAR